MDLCDLSDRPVRWISSATNVDQESWEALAEIIEGEIRLALIDLDDAEPSDPITPDEFIVEGRRLFDALSALTKSPLIVRRLRAAMERVGRSTVQAFHLCNRPTLSVIPGGASPVERPSARYIDDGTEVG